MKKTKRSFQDKLRRQIVFYTTIIVAISLLLFLGSLIFYNYSLSTNQAASVNQYLSELFTNSYTEYDDFLKSISNNENYQNYILNHNDESSIFYSFYTLNMDKKIKSNMVLTDCDGNILLETFPIFRDNNYFKSFNNMIREKVYYSRNPNSIETGLYSFIETSSEYVISGPVLKESRIIGFVMLYLSGDDWNYELSSQEFNGVITDRFDNIIATSSKMIANNINKFKPMMNSDRIRILNTEYIIRHTRLEAQDINIYSLVEVKMNINQYLPGVLIILVLGVSMLAITEVFSKKIAVNNSRSISKLINEIYVVMEGNLNYKINLNTGDEIETIAENINELVERIKALNERNTELINTRRISEIKQLEAQFSPHFLYNTLETIRYSIFFDRKIASDLISLLTQILRYSISKGSDKVKFSENLEYTKVFLEIYKYRFDKNFDYIIDVSDECNDIYVPKLLLQPIIENSIKYGYENKTKLNIKINARIKDEYLTIAVEDDGSGIEKEKLDSINKLLGEETNSTNHLGLFNTSRRLILQFGEESSMHLDSKVGEWTRVTLKIKMDKSREVSDREGDMIVQGFGS